MLGAGTHLPEITQPLRAGLRIELASILKQIPTSSTGIHVCPDYRKMLHKMSLSKPPLKRIIWQLPGGPVVSTLNFIAKGVALIPSRGNCINFPLRATQPFCDHITFFADQKTFTGCLSAHDTGEELVSNSITSSWKLSHRELRTNSMRNCHKGRRTNILSSLSHQACCCVSYAPVPTSG